MRIEQLIYCIEVANCKSMSQASKKLFITQSSLSTAIKKLEDELGFIIFNRTLQGIQITEKGKMLLDKAQQILDISEEIMALAMDNNIIQSMSIAAVPAVCHTITTELIKEFNKGRYPINLNIKKMRPDNVLQELISGKADVAIGSYTNSMKGKLFNLAERNEIIIEPIYDDQLYAYLPRNHCLARNESVAIGELDEYVPALFDDSVLVDIDEKKGIGKVEKPKNYYAFSDQSSIKQVVADGLAVAVLPYSAAYKDIYVTSGLVKVVPLNDVNTYITMYIAYKSTEYLPNKTELVIGLLHKIYDKVNEDMQSTQRKITRSNQSNTCLRY